jgi:hypothetical protein
MQKRVVNLHTSDIRRFKACRRQWRYSSPLWYAKAPKKTPAPLARGKVWHKGFEPLYASETLYDGEYAAGVFREAYLDVVRHDRANGATYEAEEINEALNMGATILPMYAAWAKKNDNFKVIEAEQRYQIPLIETDDTIVNFTWRADQIIEKRGKWWIHDFKTVGTLPTDPSFLDFDEQITGYLKASELYFQRPFVGAVFTYILAVQPSEPELTLKGKLSMDKRMRTTPEIYYRKLLELGLDPREYKDFLQHLNQRQWFVRFEIMKTAAEKDILWEEHKRLALQMIDPGVFIYKAPKPLECQMCSFKSPCLVENTGRNFEIILENEFVNAEAW